MVAVAHTKRGEQSAADAATADLPLIQAAAAPSIDTTSDAFKASIDGKTVDNRGDAAEAIRAWAGKHGHGLITPTDTTSWEPLPTLAAKNSAQNLCPPGASTMQLLR